VSDRQLLFDLEVPKGWRLLKVDELKSDERSSCSAGPFGSNISSKYFVDEGIPVIRGANLRNDLTQFVPEGFVFVSPERAAKHYKGQHVKAGDLVFTCWGTLGQVGLIPKNGPFPAYIISNKQLKFRPNAELADPCFLFYYFACREMVNHINSIAIGAAVPGINLGILKNLDVVLPPLPLQRKIASILSAYDDLIENNTRRIAILEEMAQAIYREWFVNFRFPGHGNVKLIDSPLGQIPEGWEWSCLSDLGFIGRGKSRHRPRNAPELYGGPYPLFQTGDIKAASTFLWKYSQTYSEAGLAQSKLWKPGTLCITIAANIADTAILAKTACFPDSVVGFVSNPDEQCVYFVKLYLETIRRQMQNVSRGTTQDNLSLAKLLSFKVPTPNSSVLLAFHNSVTPLFDNVLCLAKKNDNLRTTRDMLLPKLISGQLDVEDLVFDVGIGVTQDLEKQ